MLAPLGALADDPGCEESEPGMMAASIAHAMPAAKMGTTSFLCATMAKRRDRCAQGRALAMLSRRCVRGSSAFSFYNMDRWVCNQLKFNSSV